MADRLQDRLRERAKMLREFWADPEAVGMNDLRNDDLELAADLDAAADAIREYERMVEALRALCGRWEGFGLPDDAFPDTVLAILGPRPTTPDNPKQRGVLCVVCGDVLYMSKNDPAHPSYDHDFTAVKR